MFIEEDESTLMTWKSLGDVNEGRPNLGEQTTVLTYRLFAFTMRDVLAEHYGEESARKHFREAGKKAGILFCRELLDTRAEFDPFLAELQQTLADLGIGILKLEEADLEKSEFTLSIYEDLDCSGLSNTDETVCDYDEGFIAGILEAYTGKEFKVREVDCWASGGRNCRFKAKQV
ncbi:MAG: 4-vinyl reductase [Planctomycetes bacterium]|nr:4-vinyl reductase [Planctomycetota bacterium]